jgi:hypothetical protein
MLEQGMHKVMIFAEIRVAVSGSPLFRPPVSQRKTEHLCDNEQSDDDGIIEQGCNDGNSEGVLPDDEFDAGGGPLQEFMSILSLQ